MKMKLHLKEKDHFEQCLFNLKQFVTKHVTKIILTTKLM